ncbi:MAG: pantoate--beta-alanine ligase [Acidimicrobiales bacterium]
MQVIDSGATFAKTLDSERQAGHGVGLVPPMGYLHQGHLSLIERARQECDVVAVTIFVNPLQFGPTEDLDLYPRDIDGDLSKARSAGAHYVFAPSEAEMYARPPMTEVSVAPLEGVLEGQVRPGHLVGVATVVAKLFAMAGRCRAYFGEKDYQQLVMLRRMASDLSFPVEVVGCPTVRQSDGLALSSRNVRLDSLERRAACVVQEALAVGRSLVISGERRPGTVSRAMAAVVSAEPAASLDYAVVVDPETLGGPSEITGPVRLLVAARIGDVRIIDNVGAEAP